MTNDQKLLRASELMVSFMSAPENRDIVDRFKLKAYTPDAFFEPVELYMFPVSSDIEEGDAVELVDALATLQRRAERALGTEVSLYLIPFAHEPRRVPSGDAQN